MRRKEFLFDDYEEMQKIAHRAEVGYLGILTKDGYPRTVPLNFLLMNQSIYFHGAQDGEKFDILNTNAKATFSIVEPYSIIPSNWLARDYACPATAFFKSVYLCGNGMLVEDLTEKAQAMQALMEKYQPEGNYKPITADDPMYIKPLQQVSVFKIEPVRVDMKFKFGQNFSEKKRWELIGHLEKRNSQIDLRTAEEIRKTLVDENRA